MLLSRDDLVFSANNLQVFEDCERRFELRYLKELKWPAVESEPVLESERFLANGRRFHEMIQRDILNIPLAESVFDREPDIQTWWDNYKKDNPVDLVGNLFPEKTLVGKLEDNIVVATYDLIIVTDDGKYVIYDWKTWKNPRSPEWMKSRMQARLYPWLLAESGESLNNEAKIHPEFIEMRYWYASAPEKSFSFNYSSLQYEKDREFLRSMIQRIKDLPDDVFALTEDVKECAYCPYRSYCGRGKRAGRFDNLNRSPSEELGDFLGSLDDYESIAF